MSPAESPLVYRTALEALRNGVPNRYAVRFVGTDQAAVEQQFAERLDAIEGTVEQNRQAPGLLFAGSFGTGKSHLLCYLEDNALSRNFVCSRIVISKETPLYDLGKLYRSAVENADAPGLNGQVVRELAPRLRTRSPDYGDFARWVDPGVSGLNSLFAATLKLNERLNSDPQVIEEIADFWSGGPIYMSKLKQDLRRVGAASYYTLRKPPVRELDVQRVAFLPRLLRAGGYRGWIWLVDEVELIGRYSLLQRARSYAKLARLLGATADYQFPGLVVVAAIVDGFAAEAIEKKGDRDLAAERLQRPGTDEAALEASWAETGMRIIERDALVLDRPDDETLHSTKDKLKTIHAGAYDWNPPDVPDPAPSGGRVMRSYVRWWITQWDLRRLYPEAEVSLQELDIPPDHYDEDSDLQTPSAESSPNERDNPPVAGETPPGDASS